MTLPIPAPRAEGVTSTTPVPLYWREDGPADAPPLVLLHGGPGASHEYLYPQMLALAETHRVITYDQRGGGRSRSLDSSPITWRTQVEDLAAVLRELVPVASTPAVAPILAGYSWGALLAMLYAIEQRRQPTWPPIDRLLLVSPAPITSAWRALFDAALSARQLGPEIRALRDQLTASGLRERDPAAFRQRSFELSVAGYFADVQRAESLTPFRVTARTQQSVWDSLGTFDLRDELRAVRLPVLVVHGREDPIPLESAVAVSEALNGRLVVLDACGHVPYVEQPEGLFNAARRFLA
ncbi:MAG: alpha/beta hydrolase [Gemmatimonadaceae bacterium]|nr:alpha/beta hydrolase [Gemmatimonadaceae bacterium]